MPRNLLALCIAAALLVACATTNKYAENYQAKDTGAAALPADVEPKIRRAVDLEADVADWESRGYRVVGRADFNDELQEEEGISAQARAVGASVVLIKNEFLKLEVVDKTVYRPNSTTDNTTRVHRGSPNSSASTLPSTDPLSRKGSIEHKEQKSLYRHQAVFMAR